MMELELKSDELIVDLKKSGASLSNDGSLKTAVIISLLTDRRADPDDELPEYTEESLLPPDRKGWCGDALPPVAGDRMGSRLWLLERAKQTEETRQRAIEYAEEALQWLVDDGHVVSVSVEAAWVQHEFLQLKALIKTHDGNLSVVTPTQIGQGGSYAL